MTHTHTQAPPTCCCLPWISDLSPLRRQQDTHMYAAGVEGVCRLKLIKMLQILFTDELSGVTLLSSDSLEAKQSSDTELLTINTFFRPS